MLLFQDCFPLLGSSPTKWDCVSATNENITFKPGSNQSGKQEWALYSATQLAFRYHPTGALRKLKKSSPVVWKEPPKVKKHLKPLLLRPSCYTEWGLGTHETRFSNCNSFSCFSLPLGSFLSKQEGNTSSFLKHQLQESAGNQTMLSGFCRQPGQMAPSFPKNAALLSCLLLSSQKRAQGLQVSQRSFILCTQACSRMIWEPEYTCSLRQSADIPNSKLKPEKAHKTLQNQPNLTCQVSVKRRQLCFRSISSSWIFNCMI